MTAVRIEHDGFEGDVIGSYVTREGKRGAVVQQTGTRVVHVYGEKWLGDYRPTPAADVAELVGRHEWLIRKNGYFYRPNRSGYTMEKVAAGRYTKAEADAEASIEPENFKVLHESEIPDAPEVEQLKTRLAALSHRVGELTRENEELAFLLNEGGTWEQQIAAAERRAEAAEAKLAEAVAALEPFATACRANTTGLDTDDAILNVPLTVEHLRRARSVASTIASTISTKGDAG